MKQELSSELVSSCQDNSENRKITLDKKRKIRKDKLQSSVIDFADLRSIDTKKLTREERAKVQKAKNREAAQKSRDTHKQYVKNLENEVKQLRDQCSRRLCWKCKQEIEEATGTDSNYTDNQTDVHSRTGLGQFGLQNDEISNPIHFPIDNNDVFEEELFMRVEEDNSPSFPFMKFGLLVLAITLAVICLNCPADSSLKSRALMEIHASEPKQKESTVIQKIEVPLADPSKDDRSKTAIVKIEQTQHGLIALKGDDCLKSLMKIETPLVDTKRSLTSYSDSTPSQNYLAHQQGILLCQVRMPKSRSLNEGYPSSLRTPLVRLYLLGSQIKDLISNFNLLIPVRDSSNIQSNGIYQVLARIKQVNMVSNHNCLL